MINFVYGGEDTMRTNVDLNKELVKKGLKMTKLPSMKALVNYALEELVRHKHRLELLSLMGSRCWKGDLSQMRGSRV